MDEETTANSACIKKDINNVERLRPHWWKPGQSGNPSGRPKGIIGAALWKRLLMQKGAKLEDVVEGILRSCAKGNPKAFAVVRDSVDGRPLTPVDLNVSGLESLGDILARARKRSGK